MTYFPFMDYWWFYLAFSGFVALLLALDLGVLHRTARLVSFCEAAGWSIVWICVALGFNVAFYRYALWIFAHDSRLLQTPGFSPEEAAQQIGLQFLSGYLVEKALSLDNIFVFVVIFSFFGIPAIYHRRELFYGILGALLFRGIFIAAGSALLQYHWIMVLFGAFLILTGIKMMFAPDRAIEPEKNPLIRLFRRFCSGYICASWSEALRSIKRRAPRYAALIGSLVYRSERYCICDRFRAGHFHPDALTTRCFHVEHPGHPGPACALFPARRSR
jgi:tellurite resistance protein TerC